MDNYILIKRFFLIFIVMPVLIFVPNFYWARNIYYINFSVIFSTLAILGNFPKIIHFFHAKPVTYDDLEDENAVTLRTRKRFQKVYLFIVAIIFSIIITGVLDYYLDRFNNTSLSNKDKFALVGGFISLTLRLGNIATKFLLEFLHCSKLLFTPRPKMMCNGIEDIPELTLDNPTVTLSSNEHKLNNI
jgi:hypothetical protein